ncbi:hypothetical protein BT96DRAFT_1006156 [Gymnopus androsaceus JB14]|uniref:Uncharacterized protein n=1 Tax=Gymnopus androsaceus JB14 TaxID=1447944 RepID=A0A6A4GLM6_9AGAR|nr:hypothetical protein BT96DRAFT_1006156 [Gymnopus androsaceus JB14]
MLDSENIRETVEISVEPQIQPRTSQPSLLIDRLANELLSLIFDFTCEENLLQEYPRTNEKPTGLTSPVISYLPALAISAVCARWRSLALALPDLWARLKLKITEEQTILDAFMATLQLCLDRSAQTPLVLDVFIDYIKDGLYDDNPPALNLLLQYSSCWKKFRCRTDRHIFENPLSLPILEDLSLGCVGMDDVGDIFYSPRAAPKLRALEIDLPPSDTDSRLLF